MIADGKATTTARLLSQMVSMGFLECVTGDGTVIAIRGVTAATDDLKVSLILGASVGRPYAADDAAESQGSGSVDDCLACSVTADLAAILGANADGIVMVGGAHSHG